MDEIDARQQDPTSIQIHYDCDFHLAIAKATRNEFIHGFLSYLKPMIVPRLRLGYVVAPGVKDTYYARIHNEHSSIVAAIERQDGRTARQAMRKHLHNSLMRVRSLAEASGVEATDAEQQGAAASLFAELKRQSSGSAEGVAAVRPFLQLAFAFAEAVFCFGISPGDAGEFAFLAVSSASAGNDAGLTPASGPLADDLIRKTIFPFCRFSWFCGAGKTAD